MQRSSSKEQEQYSINNNDSDIDFSQTDDKIKEVYVPKDQQTR